MGGELELDVVDVEVAGEGDDTGAVLVAAVDELDLVADGENDAVLVEVGWIVFVGHCYDLPMWSTNPALPDCSSAAVAPWMTPESN